MLSQRILQTSNPPLVAIGKLASQTKGCISLGQGAPFYSPNIEFIQKKFCSKFTEQFNRYTVDQGIMELRTAIQQKLQEDNHITVSTDSIIVTPGANPAFTNILLTITDPGDKIILLSPYYFNHEMSATLANVEIIEVPLKNDFSIDEQMLRNTLQTYTIKAIVLVNPGNPTGAVHTKEDLKIIRDLIEGTSTLLIADETYEYFTYAGTNHVSAASIKGLAEQTISVQSFSKTYGIPGWRLGYYYGPEEIIQQSIKVQDTTVICAPAPAQNFGLQLLKHRRTLIPDFKNYLERNYHLAMDLIEEVSWLENRSSKGAYYLFPHQTTNIPSFKLSKKLITDNKVHIVHGDAFGEAGKEHFRISYANVSEAELIEAFARLKHAK